MQVHRSGLVNGLALAEALRVFPCSFFFVWFLSPIIYLSNYYALAKTPRKTLEGCLVLSFTSKLSALLH